MNIIPEILARKSIRAFSDTPIEPEIITEIFEAARWAASSFNEQPWRFIYATKQQPQLFQKLLNCLVPFNQQWAKTAYMLIAVVTKNTFTKNNTPNQHSFHDAGWATANLALQATKRGLFTHAMAGFDSAKATENLKISDEFTPVTFLAVGYNGELKNLPEELQKTESEKRTRKPLNELVYWGEFLNPKN